MELNIVEKFLILAQHPTKGRFVIPDLKINHGIIGAILLEMSIDNKIVIENDRLILKNTKNDDNQIIAEVSEIINNSKKLRKIKNWIPKLENKARKYKWIILKDLVRKKIIRIEKKKFLGIIPYKSCYLINSKIRYDLIKELKRRVQYHRDLDSANVSVLGLIEACHMYKVLTTEKAELKRIKKELKKIIKESPIADTVDKTIKEVQAAVISAVVATSAVTTAVAGSN